MADVAVKQRLRYEKAKAKQYLLEDGYAITEGDNNPVCFSAVKEPFYERKIKIVIDRIEKEDIKAMDIFPCLNNQTKEIWLVEKGGQKFRKFRVVEGGLSELWPTGCQSRIP